MTSQILGSGMRAELRMTLFDQQIMNTLWFSLNGDSPSPTSCQAVADYLASWWQAQMRPLLTNAITLREVYVRGAEREDGNPEYTSVLGLPITGEEQLESMPGNVALCVSFRTGMTGRSYRGRNYVSGMSDGKVSGNQFQASFVNNVVQAYTELKGNVPGGMSWVVASFQSNGAVLNPGVPRPIQAVLATDVNVDSMRSRLSGRGR